jgi:regulator of protease activity HflC (stomatin/prohibitin superfamily)
MAEFMTRLVVLLLLAIVAIVVLAVRSRFRQITVFEYERGLLYVRGRFRAVVDPGQYWIWTPTRMLTKVDTRPRIAAVPGQEVLTADGIAVKLSLVASYRVADPVLAVNGQASYENSLHTELQLAIRRLVSAEPIDSLLEKRAQLGGQLLELVRGPAATFGLELETADVKDLTLPGELKKLFTQVTKARQEGLAALERARGETAALRNLANAARLVQDNPSLLQLRLLQVVGEQSGNTVVLGFPNGSAPVPIAGAGKERIAGPSVEAPES